MDIVVKDIKKLRANYEQCQEQLSLGSETQEGSVGTQLNAYKAKKYKKLLKKEIEKNRILRSDLESIYDSISSVDDSMSKYEKLLKAKDEKIKALEEKLNSTKTIKKKRKKEKIEIFKASSFRLNKESEIYNRPNGKKINIWEIDTTFTSNKKTQNWMKITGFFIEKRWKRAKTEMWVRYENISKKK